MVVSNNQSLSGKCNSTLCCVCFNGISFSTEWISHDVNWMWVKLWREKPSWMAGTEEDDGQVSKEEVVVVHP